MPNRLKQYRKTHKLSRKELAHKLDCAESYVGHIERGIRNVSAEKAVEWEKLHGIPREVFRPDLWPA